MKELKETKAFKKRYSTISKRNANWYIQNPKMKLCILVCPVKTFKMT
jgi:hypothetical protein